MFFKKKDKKEVNLYCYTTMPRLVDYFPIEPTRKVMPDWFRNLPAYIEPEHKSTLKICPGVNDFFNLGVTIPLWADHIFEWKDGQLLDLRTPLKDINPGYSHPDYQWGKQFPNWTHVKLHNPWYFETDRMIKFMVIQSTWNMDDFNHFTIPPGVIEFKYQHHAHLQMFLPPGHAQLTLEAGTPMVHLIPLEDVKINLVFKEMDQQVYNRVVKNHRFTFDNIYYKTRKLLESKNK